MRAGQLRDVVRLEKEVKADNGGGGYDLSWVPVTTVRGHLFLERGRERVEAGRLSSAVAGTLRIRYQAALAELDGSWRAVIDDVAYNIRSVTNPDRRRRALELVVETGVAV